MTKIYHKDVFMPRFNYSNFWKGVNYLVPSLHCIHRQLQREFFVIPLDKVKAGDIYEVTTVDGEIDKINVKIEHQNRDFYYVIGKNGTIITGWHHRKGAPIRNNPNKIYTTKLSDSIRKIH